ncbi:hypothetical protein FOA52_003297 [Chlamydomonas sp. UWO 241]|nr:hypothetical protein FOA52_003297 [Chlamydomonas sp. UWO 241]
MEPAPGASTSGRDPWATTSFTWRIKDFSKLTSVRVRSDCFEAGICTWRLMVDPDGSAEGNGTHLAVFLVVQDEMWEPNIEFEFTLVNQADASKSITTGGTRNFNSDTPSWGARTIIELSVLKDAAAGWLMKDTLVLTVDITVKREDRFQLDTGGVPCDMARKLPCGAEVGTISKILQMASPFFCNTLEDVQGGVPIPRLTAALAHGRLQLDEFRELCLDRLRGMTREQRKIALNVEVEVGSGAGAARKRVIRAEVKDLGQALCFELFAITAADTVALSDDDDDDEWVLGSTLFLF